MNKIQKSGATIVLVLLSIVAVMGAYTTLPGGWNADVPYQVGNVDIMKSMQFRIVDSLAANSATLGVVTLARSITVHQIDVYTPDAYVGPGADSAATVIFRSGSSSAAGAIDSGETYQSTDMANVDFAASLQCSLLTTDGGGTCTGGEDGLITVWYTDN